MSSAILFRVTVGIGLVLIQVLAALPWLALLEPGAFSSRLKRPGFWGTLLGIVVGGGVLVALLLTLVSAREGMEYFGRLYGALLQLQLFADLLVGIFAVLLLVWPKGAAVALAAFREGIRQPLFWGLGAIGFFFLIVSPFLPYFTFGEDHLMVKEIGFDIAMLFAVLFAVLMASLSIHEEIEGRTAVTLMSKPVSRREFLIGKYVGILLAAGVMTALLGWFFEWTMLYKRWYDRIDPIPVPPAFTSFLASWLPTAENHDFYRGIGMWFVETSETLPGLVLGFCQVMVLLAIAVALATRLPMVVNLPICLLVYLLGHLAPVLVQVSQPRVGTSAGDVPVFRKMVGFVAQVFDTVLPGLQFFTLGPAVVSDVPLPMDQLAIYVAQVLIYAVIYTTIALLFGLILFEDRDLA